jgi:hypothetical protein
MVASDAGRFLCLGVEEMNWQSCRLEAKQLAGCRGERTN